jgi:tetratricopeptide (TPR) repeat protein
MGVVLRAQDDVFHRSLAVKVLLANPAEHPDQVRRFLEEAQVMGQLQHPSIAPIHTLGWLADGRPYFSMKLIHGQTLAGLLRQRPSPSHELPRFLGIFGQLCQAVAYAHSRGILHRDLKPSNVMVGAFGEVQVMDWGLAKVLASGGREPLEGSAVPPQGTHAPRSPESSREQTQMGAVLGTPAYMAPEQARGEVDQIDERCDVFGLGAILCVILTGRPPYLGSKSAEVYPLAVRGALEGAYAELEACGADAELVTLARACLAREPQDRPRHAGLVSDAVGTYQAQVQEKLHQAEVARAQAQVKAAEERKRRRLTLILAALVVLLVAVGGAATWWYQQQQGERALERAEREAERANQAAAQAQRRAVEEVRQERARGEIQAALREATDLQQRAWKLVDQPLSWRATLEAARSATTRARVLLDQEPHLAAGELAAEVGRLTRAVEVDEKDRLVVAAFEKVLLRLSQFDPRFTEAEADRELLKALATWGLPVGVPPEQAKVVLRQRPRSIQNALMAILGFCAQSPALAKAQQEWLMEVLEAADPDPWRQQVRQAILQGDPARLTRLVSKVDVARHPPHFFIQISHSPLLQWKSILGLLRRAQRQYPQDFWLNFHLAWSLNKDVFPHGSTRRARAEEIPQLDEAIRYYTAALALRPESPGVSNNLGGLLRSKGDVAGAIACYRKALDLDPNFSEAHYNLSRALCDKGDVAGAIASLKKTLDLNPRDAWAHTNLGIVLSDQGDRKGAIACFHNALKLNPNDANAHYNLGNTLQEQGDLKGAISHYQRAVELDPTMVRAHTNLGNALARQGDLDGAIVSYKNAIALDPKLAKAHYNLGRTLYDAKDLDGAIASYRKAIDLDPRYAIAHNNLGLALQVKGDLAGAMASYRKSLELDPKNARAHYNLGMALYAKKDVVRAIASLKKALDLEPTFPQGHYNLGVALYMQGDLKGAMVCYRKASELEPRYVKAHTALGQTLLISGRFQDAQTSLKRALALLPPENTFRPTVAQLLQACERYVRLDAGLPAILRGDEQPKDGLDRLQLADFCQRYKRRYRAAAGFYESAFAAGAERTPQHTYSAACAAVLAAAGQGIDANQPGAKERARLRRLALDWLREALKDHAKQLADTDAKGRQALQQTLQHWQKNSDLVSVRDKEAIAKLSEDERADWQQLWDEVEALRQNAGAP